MIHPRLGPNWDTITIRALGGLGVEPFELTDIPIDRSGNSLRLMRQDGDMFRIGLTGGIAAGKSVVAQRLAELGAHVIDHDVLARDAVAIGSVGLTAIEREFGRGVLCGDGSLDRPALGRIVFGDSVALGKLNDIVHPEVFRLSREAEDRAALAGGGVVVHDIPLLVETGQQNDFDLLVVVDAPREVRVDRLVQSRGLSVEDAWARVESQIADGQRLAVADVILDGVGSVDQLRHQVDLLWERVTAAR